MASRRASRSRSRRERRPQGGDDDDMAGLPTGGPSGRPSAITLARQPRNDRRSANDRGFLRPHALPAAPAHRQTLPAAVASQLRLAAQSRSAAHGRRQNALRASAAPVATTMPSPSTGVQASRSAQGKRGAHRNVQNPAPAVVAPGSDRSTTQSRPTAHSGVASHDSKSRRSLLVWQAHSPAQRMTSRSRRRGGLTPRHYHAPS